MKQPTTKPKTLAEVNETHQEPEQLAAFRKQAEAHFGTKVFIKVENGEMEAFPLGQPAEAPQPSKAGKQATTQKKATTQPENASQDVYVPDFITRLSMYKDAYVFDIRHPGSQELLQLRASIREAERKALHRKLGYK